MSKARAPVERLPAVKRTGEGLRDALFDEIDRLRDGRGDRRRAMAIVELARQITKLAWLEVELARSVPGPEGGPINTVPTMRLGELAAEPAP